MRIQILSALCLLLASVPALACDKHGVTGIVEENEMYIGVDDKASNDMTEARFNKILDRVEKIYAPIVQKMGAKLMVSRNWDDGTVNAYAQQQGKTWKISMFGGLARHETVTDDAFALVACHEMGHHLGGAPKKKSFFGSAWASNEGQADYFGNSKCLRKYMEKDNNVRIVKRRKINKYAAKKCAANFETEDDVALCIRGAMAGMSLANLFRALRKLEKPLRFETPDSGQVSKTNDNHPAPQCRLDTYFQGALCSIDAYIDVDQKDPLIGTCNRVDGHKDGLRPLCWYKPTR